MKRFQKKNAKKMVKRDISLTRTDVDMMILAAQAFTAADNEYEGKEKVIKRLVSGIDGICRMETTSVDTFSVIALALGTALLVAKGKCGCGDADVVRSCKKNRRKISSTHKKICRYIESF